MAKKEIVRNPTESTHRASPIRTHVMKQLGLQTPGFWSDWAKRKINPYGPDYETPFSFDRFQTPDIEKMRSKSRKIDLEPTKSSSLKNLAPQWVKEEGKRQVGRKPTGKTRENLRNTEMQLVRQQTKWLKQRNPILSSTVLDTMTLQTITMNTQMMMYMADNPSKLLSQAASNYFESHPPASASGTAQTQFEKQMGMINETKKKAAKRKGYAVAEINKTINKIKKQPVHSSPTYKGSSLNIGQTGGYNSTIYFSPLG